MPDFTILIPWILASSGWVLVLFIFVLLVFKTENLLILSGKVIGCLRLMGAFFSKKSIEQNIRGIVLKASKIAARECVGALPYDLKISWVKEKSRQSFLDENQVIIRMSDTKDPSKNIIIAMREYVKCGLIPQTRNFVSDKLIRMTDLVMVRRLLLCSYRSALPSFLKNEVSNIRDTSMHYIFDNLMKLDKNGMFTRVFLNELVKLSYLIDYEARSPDITREIDDFASFLFTIASRERGEKVPLRFRGKYIKIKILLAAREDSQEEIEFLRKIINDSLEFGYQTVYILALGYKMAMAIDVAKQYEEKENMVSEIQYSNFIFVDSFRNSKYGVCIEISLSENKKAFTITNS